MSIMELNLSLAAQQYKHPIQSYKCGDMNNTLIKTEKGKTILNFIGAEIKSFLLGNLVKRKWRRGRR